MNERTHRAVKASLAALTIFSSYALAASKDAQSRADRWVPPARAERQKNPVPDAQAARAAGKAIYSRECATCHGTSGKGDGPDANDLRQPPGDLSAAGVREQSDGALYWKITEGRKPMPSFARLLKDEERWQVVLYLRTLAKP